MSDWTRHPDDLYPEQFMYEHGDGWTIYREPCPSPHWILTHPNDPLFMQQFARLRDAKQAASKRMIPEPNDGVVYAPHQERTLLASTWIDMVVDLGGIANDETIASAVRRYALPDDAPSFTNDEVLLDRAVMHAMLTQMHRA